MTKSAQKPLPDHYGHDPKMCRTCVNRAALFEEMLAFIKHFIDGKIHDGLEMTEKARDLIRRCEDRS
jgi:hypothetical protein